MFRTRAFVITALIALLMQPLTATDRHEFSVSELEGLQFKSAPPQGTDGPVTIHETLRSNASLFGAYELGSESLLNYREPVLTRGSTGVALFRSASPAVVLVAVGRVVKDDFQPEGLGSGAIVDPRGYILTNWHVIKGYSVGVIFLKPLSGADIGKSRTYIAKVVAQNMVKDLALLKPINPPPGLPVLRIGPPSAIQVAQDIHVIGHPHGHCWSYTTGVVSQIRDGYQWSYSDGSAHEARVIQLQTAINPGNSGGPVFDDSGNMIGLVAMGEEGQNLNYAIAADEISAFLSLWLPPVTRGVSKPTLPDTTQVPKFTLETAKTGDGLSVSRSSGNGVSTYVVMDERGTPIAAFVKIGTSLLVRASEWESKGFFKRYDADLRGGKKIRAEANGEGLANFAHR